MEGHFDNARAVIPWRKQKRVLSPSDKKDRKTEYFGYETRRAIKETLKYAADMYRCRAQGLNENDFYKFYTADIRMADAVDSRTGVNIMEDWKQILFEDEEINRIGLGAKVIVGEDTYLVTNPDPKSGMNGTAILRRCNAIWSHLDFYGNVLKEPFVWMKQQIQASSNEYLYYMVVPNMYQKCVMQINDETRELSYNRRMVLGSAAYEVRGLIDFLQDATNDMDSTHLYYFDLQFQETIPVDDRKREIADAYGFSWSLNIGGLPEETVPGKTFALTVKSVRNGKELSVIDGVTYGRADADSEMESYGDKPISYLFESGDESVATVDAAGNVTAVGAGACVITVRLEQNPEIASEAVLNVTDEAAESLVWVQCADAVRQYQSVTLECRRFVGGAADPEDAVYAVVCRDSNAASWETEKGALTITGYVPGETVVIRASVGGMTDERRLRIESY